MLRAQILDGFRTIAFSGNRAHQKLVLRGNGNAEGVAIAGHIEYGFSNHGSLPDHADFRWALRHQEGFYLVILFDDSTVSRSGGGLELYRSADRKSTRLNSSHVEISYAVFCLKKKKKYQQRVYIRAFHDISAKLH